VVAGDGLRVFGAELPVHPVPELGESHRFSVPASQPGEPRGPGPPAEAG
jgi:hypothetical protein